MSIRTSRLLIVLGLALAAGVHLDADFRDAYRRAMQARNRRNWADAVKYLQLAIQEQPKETGAPINISGAELEPYLPYFQLGLALYNRQDCAGALDAWKTADQSGAVLRSKYAETYRKSRFDCEGRLARSTQPADAAPTPAPPPINPAEVTQALAAAEKSLQSAEQLEGVVRTLAADPLLKGDWVQQSGLAAAHTRAQGFLADAREALETGRRNSDPRALKSAATIAASAEQQLDLLRQAAEGRKAQLQAAASRSTSAPAPPASPPEAAAVRPSGAGAPPPATPSPDVNLLPLIDAFMKGRYREATTLARQLREATGPIGAQAALFGAAAHYSLFLRGGERDRAERDRAAEYARRTRTLDPLLQPDPGVFSPRFAEFFRNQR